MLEKDFDVLKKLGIFLCKGRLYLPSSSFQTRFPTPFKFAFSICVQKNPTNERRMIRQCRDVHSLLGSINRTFQRLMKGKRKKSISTCRAEKYSSSLWIRTTQLSDEPYLIPKNILNRVFHFYYQDRYPKRDSPKSVPMKF